MHGRAKELSGEESRRLRVSRRGIVRETGDFIRHGSTHLYILLVLPIGSCYVARFAALMVPSLTTRSGSYLKDVMSIHHSLYMAQAHIH